MAQNQTMPLRESCMVDHHQQDNDPDDGENGVGDPELEFERSRGFGVVMSAHV